MMTFREKALIAKLLGIVLPFGTYAVWAATGPHPLAAVLLALTAALGVQMLIQAAVVGVLRLFQRPEKPDERDEMIELRAMRVGYFALLGGVAMATYLSVFGHRAGPSLLNVLLAVITVGEALRITMQLVYYRRA